MGTGERYTVQQIRETLANLSPIFDVVRIVDPRDTSVLSLGEDGTVRREPYKCFHVWNKTCRCKNCTSINGLFCGCARRDGKMHAAGTKRARHRGNGVPSLPASGQKLLPGRNGRHHDIGAYGFGKRKAL